MQQIKNFGSLLQADGRISNQDLAEKVFCRPLLVSASSHVGKNGVISPLPLYWTRP